MREITAEQLRARLRYDAFTGVFAWINGPRRGQPAGSVNSIGYVQIRLLGKGCSAHRLAWLYAHGQWPAADIDHVNGIRRDNRIENLRDVSRSINLQNCRSPRIDNKSSGVLGVEARGSRFRARIQVGGAMVSLGTFATAPEAHQAYLGAKRQLHEGCTL